MQTDLSQFLRQLAGVITMSLVPVVLVAFISLPLNMGRHPGDAEPHRSTVGAHMS
ncbi:hypothetical protein PFX98_06265 [Paucibacter sediminis]|uniref:Uncharacterized protein n=1 Tax=Paucibacter sediminis TaxID=3019553 RepID=A0AA95NNH3_9BURK|nr:hypothetical protein [Paucibacter sp. S2-9]WIT13211.1 hypothetical protein PFX98_06265 [Paucibacter sp. S2-9]